MPARTAKLLWTGPGATEMTSTLEGRNSARSPSARVWIGLRRCMFAAFGPPCHLSNEPMSKMPPRPRAAKASTENHYLRQHGTTIEVVHDKFALRECVEQRTGRSVTGGRDEQPDVEVLRGRVQRRSGVIASQIDTRSAGLHTVGAFEITTKLLKHILAPGERSIQGSGPAHEIFHERFADAV